MRRRLDLAAGLLGAPDVLFLDEPTTGLDPVSRAAVWEIVTDLVRAGTAVILTTQYLEEADRLANDIVVLGRGSVIATGTPAMLKAGWAAAPPLSRCSIRACSPSPSTSCADPAWQRPVWTAPSPCRSRLPATSRGSCGSSTTPGSR